MQSCLEKRGIDERENEINQLHYNINNQYSALHSDALSNGDPYGKGTGHGGHTHVLPDCSKPDGMIDYSQLDTFRGGGSCDIAARDNMINISMYNHEAPYSANLVDTHENVRQGQFVNVSRPIEPMRC